jgi:hypothetical protein
MGGRLRSTLQVGWSVRIGVGASTVSAQSGSMSDPTGAHVPDFLRPADMIVGIFLEALRESADPGAMSLPSASGLHKIERLMRANDEAAIEEIVNAAFALSE